MLTLRPRKKPNKVKRVSRPVSRRPDPEALGRLLCHTGIEDWIGFDTETTGLSIPHGVRPFLFSAWSLQKLPGLKHRLHNDNPLCDFTGDLPGYGGLWNGSVEWTDRSVRWTSEQLDSLAHFLTGKNLVGFNAGFDLRMLASIGLILEFEEPYYRVHLPNHFFGASVPPQQTRIVKCGLVADAQIGVHVFDNRGPGNLDQATRYYLGLVNDDDDRLVAETKKLRTHLKKQSYADDIAFGKEPDGKDAPKSDYWMLYQEAKSKSPKDNLCAEYALRDVFRTLVLWDKAQESIKEDQIETQLGRQMAVFPAFCQLPTEGLPLHTKNLKEHLKNYGGKSKAARIVVEKSLAEFGEAKPNANSDHQIRRALFDHFKLTPVKLTDTQMPSVDKETIEVLSSQKLKPAPRRFIDAVVDYTGVSKTLEMLETYDACKVKAKSNGITYLFGGYNQTGTALTRCSSDNPNLQQIPKRKNSLRNLITVEPGWRLVSIDYSQVEVRLFVEASGDPEMKQALLDGLDIHQFTASAIDEVPYEEVTKQSRVGAKGVTFGRLYGAGDAKIIRTAGNDNIIAVYDEKFPSVPLYMAKQIALAEQKGEVHTLYGYRIWVSPEPAYKAVNCIVQGSAGDVMKEAMTRLHYHPKVGNNKDVRIVGQVHDELLFLIRDQPNWKKLGQTIKTVMESVGDIINDAYLPADAEYHPEHWGAGIPLTSA